MAQLRCPRCTSFMEGEHGAVLKCSECGFTAPVPAAVGRSKASPYFESTTNGNGHAAPTQPAVRALPKGKEVGFLVVDDSPSIRTHVMALLHTLTSSDEQIVEARNPTQAVSVFRRTDPKIVFLDMMMPRERDGVLALKAMLKTRPDAVVVILTALDRDHPSVSNAISLGARAYVRKPVTIRGLQDALDEIQNQANKLHRVI